MMKIIKRNRLSKKEKERHILLGVVALYLEKGTPVGSNTLRDNGFSDVSSATIRSHFVKLENEGYLKQQHSSGGRIPTEQAYQVYANTYLDAGIIEKTAEKRLDTLILEDTKEVASYLQQAIELLSEVTGCAVFLSTPRFDHDVILNVKLVSIDHNRCMCILITDFGLIHTEIVYVNKPLKAFALKRIEEYICAHIRGEEQLSPLDKEEDGLAQKIYNEIMVRYIIGYANFSDEDIYTTGLSRLLAYPDFNTPESLAQGLALFENANNMRALLRDACVAQDLKCWIGNELSSYSPNTLSCSLITMPYSIGGKVAGAVALLGPTRMPYRSLFGSMRPIFRSYQQGINSQYY